MTAFLQWWADHWPLLALLPFFIRVEFDRHQEDDWRRIQFRVGFLLWDWSWKAEGDFKRRREP